MNPRGTVHFRSMDGCMSITNPLAMDLQQDTVPGSVALLGDSTNASQIFSIFA